MKTKLFYLFVFLFLGKLCAQSIQFPDPNFKSILLQANAGNQIAKNFNGNYFKIDSNNDGEIQFSEALLVSDLNVNGSSISSLEGILNFKNIEFLSCNINNLSTLDLHGLSKLQRLFCGQNQLTSLDLQGCINLDTLFCYSNLFTSLDLKGLTNLQGLWCHNNLLTSLDLRALPKFNVLNCNNNQLTTLYLKNGFRERDLFFSNNPNLEYICCDEEEISFVRNLSIQYDYANLNIDSACPAILGIDEVAKSQIIIFPNPVQEILNFKSNTKINSVEIYDISGRLVRESKVTNNQLNVKDLNRGNFIVVIKTDKNSFKTKFIKK